MLSQIKCQFANSQVQYHSDPSRIRLHGAFRGLLITVIVVVRRKDDLYMNE
ncbi:hypothetical protein HGH93_02050 [Chitinophaga polysaccharea]|uniref:hypothetical protein n=1 Tax=Chitinophaga TaxID=79328 RepID=UPI001455099E|nr:MULTISPECIES: hypothetical protein [Chitinophaga]NLR56866.1 hypothetical protein [Chitinophaga polysaccharea]NLU93088.1 hypothetical protein [Chitinophaga sp. Ak27]